MLLISREALKPGGIVIVSVPNVAHWTVRLSLARGRFDYEPYGIMDATHLRWFTWKTLEKLFMKAGFELTDRRVSAGTSMKVYHTRTPWRRLSSVKLRRVLGRLSQYFPKMFGCQLVFRGRMVELPSSGDSI
jgi:hypothetical protein